jgi:hypothetical protein
VPLPPPPRWPLGVLVALGVLGAPQPASAYEDRAALSLEAGYGVIASAAPLPNHGVVAGFGAGFGLSDVWELRVDLAYAYHPEALHRFRGSAELIYVVDVLQVVPYVGLGAGFFLSADPLVIRPDFEAHAVVGFDVLLDREWTVGLAVRPILLPTSIEYDPFYLTITGRVSYLIDL